MSPINSSVGAKCCTGIMAYVPNVFQAAAGGEDKPKAQGKRGRKKATDADDEEDEPQTKKAVEDFAAKMGG